VSARVTNTGGRAGDEVVELYLTHSGIEGAPLRALAGFQHIHLAPGASQTITFLPRERDFSVVDESGVRRIVPGDVKVWIGGGQLLLDQGNRRARLPKHNSDYLCRNIARLKSKSNDHATRFLKFTGYTSKLAEPAREPSKPN
jgi:hypothetical protein